MINKFLRLLLALVLSALIYWVGPLVFIGVYRPLGWLFLRQLLIFIILVWGFWPWIIYFLNKFSFSFRNFKEPQKIVKNSLFIRFDYLSRKLKLIFKKTKKNYFTYLIGLIFKDYSSILPWFIIIGPKSSGKTSFISKINPKFESVVNNNPDINFWLTPSSLFIDPPGNWFDCISFSDSEKKYWCDLILGIKKFRKDSNKVNGIILCLNFSDFINLSFEDRQNLSLNIRDRLIDLFECWGYAPKVYFAISGLDQLKGFNYLNLQINDDQKKNGIGFVLPPSFDEVYNNFDENNLIKCFSDLEFRIQNHVLFSSIHDSSQKCGGQLPFIESMAIFKPLLIDFVKNTLSNTDGYINFNLRGVWFGYNNIDLSFFDSLNQNKNDIQNFKNLWLPLSNQILIEKSDFLENKKIKKIYQFQLSIFFIVFFFFTCWFSWGYFAEKSHLEFLSAQFTEGKRLSILQKNLDLSNTAPLLEVASQMRYALTQLKSANLLVPTPYFEHKKIESIATETYHKHLHKTLMPELHNEVKRILEKQIINGRGDIYQSLKVYLMLSRPAYRQHQDLEAWINANWDDLSNGYQSTNQDRLILLSHARTLFNLKNLPATPEDSVVVKSARAKASVIPSVTRLLQHIQGQGLPADSPDVSLSRAAGFASSMALRLKSNLPSTDPSIPGWYTRSGYTDVFLPRLRQGAIDILKEESWVLRDKPFSGNSFEFDKIVEQLSDATKSQFLQNYIRYWRLFLSDVAPRQVSGLDDAAQTASLFVDPQSPLALLVRFAARETTLTGNYEGDVDSWIDQKKFQFERGRRAVVGEIAGQHYRNKLLPEHVVDDYFESLRRFSLQMNQSQSSAASNPLSRLFEPLSVQLGIVNGAMLSGQILPGVDSFVRLRNEASRQPEPVRGVMLELIDSGRSVSVKQSGDLLNRSASGAANSICDQRLVSSFPFNRRATSEIPVQDFERLFGRQGVMSSFFNENLSPYVDKTSRPWKNKSVDPMHKNFINFDIIRSYEAADRISSVFFDSTGSLNIPVTMRFINMDSQIAESHLEVAGQILAYAHGASSPLRMDWPVSGANMTVALHVRGIDGRTDIIRFDGPWALHRLFDDGKSDVGVSDRRESLHQSRLGQVRLEWISSSSPSPIWSNLLSSFRCPN